MNSRGLTLCDSDNTAWQVALEIAIEWDKNVNRLINAVLTSDFQTAQTLAEGLKHDEEMLGTLAGEHGKSGH